MARYNLNDDQIVLGYEKAHAALKRYNEEKRIGTDEVLARNLAIFEAGRGMSLDALDRLLVARERS